jgi:membrane protein YdbS with pleckstrin-like domain
MITIVIIFVAAALAGGVWRFFNQVKWPTGACMLLTLFTFEMVLRLAPQIIK